MTFKSFLVLALVALLVIPVFAAKPTVTTSLEQTTDHFVVYECTWTSAIATADTAVICKTISTTTPWDIGYLTASDSGIGVQLETSETTLDSIRHKLVYQMCYDYTPISSNAISHDEWINVKTTTSDSTLSLHEFFNPFTSGAYPVKFRILWIETSSSLDATQNLTLRLVFPKP